MAERLHAHLVLVTVLAVVGLVVALCLPSAGGRPVGERPVGRVPAGSAATGATVQGVGGGPGAGSG
ncbi:hypothetical protein [Streptomyces lanatus]|uniref:Uncharacterized protein n=1 Tax=Streptomyces lanatus TaxID=66900 RepID=A0ABV1XRB4_9ACTN|nr:hypothetical protein [Streptomyces lanatus]GHH05308.1 hypothetical protein GCM10018780_36690 [Streptomyces lanatus]